MVTAYIINNNDILMMQRSMNKKFAPGVWAGIGGHVEPNEVNDPQETCIREIYEETGISKENLFDLKLKYIILRKSKLEIRIQYVYTAKTNIRKVIDTDEGTLFWINKNDILDRDLSTTVRMTLDHYLKYEDTLDDILVGTVSSEKEQPKINWVPLQDWES
jgi:8-oxo-dGTP diphosphatase